MISDITDILSEDASIIMYISIHWINVPYSGYAVLGYYGKEHPVIIVNIADKGYRFIGIRIIA